LETFKLEAGKFILKALKIADGRHFSFTKQSQQGDKRNK
jgi:hypothetical protein